MTNPQATSGLKPLLNRIQTKSKLVTPVDEASTALGKEIGRIFILNYLELNNERSHDNWKRQGYDIIEIFGRNINGGVISGFFREISSDERLFGKDILEKDAETGGDSFTHWFLHCIRICEDGGHYSVLPACIRSYAFFSFRRFLGKELSKKLSDGIIFDGSNDPFYLANLYQKSKLPTTRECILREFIHISFHCVRDAPLPVVTSFISPLVCIAIVSSTLSSALQLKEAFLCLSLFSQESKSIAIQSSDDVRELVRFFCRTLELLFESCMFDVKGDHSHGTLSVGYDLTTQLCELSLLAASGLNDVLDVIFGKVIPRLCVCTDYSTLPLQPVLQLLKALLSPLSNNTEEGPLHLESSTIYNLATACMLVQDEADVCCILELLHSSYEKMEPDQPATQMMCGVLSSLGYIFRSMPSCQYIAQELVHLASVKFSRMERSETNTDKPQSTSHAFDLFSDFHEDNSFLKLLAQRENHDEVELSLHAQCESLLLGLSMVSVCALDKRAIPGRLYSYLDRIVRNYHHLGRRCLPVLVATLQQFIELGSSERILPHLEFICASVAKDASCAHEIWALLRSMTSRNIPLKLQAMTVRLYPVLCNSNKRLYSRVCESLSCYASHPNVSLRVAASATIRDLAKLDLIRDVNDVIGWVQNFLADEEPLVTQFACRTLHHLIDAEELDFPMVIKVLNKRLVQVDDVSLILKLPAVIVESLVILLGSGEDSGKDDDSDDSGSNDEDEIVISHQVQVSTSGLCNIALAVCECLGNQNEDKVFDHEEELHLLSLVCESLSKYSFNSIGIMEEMIRSECLERDEYDRVKKIIKLSFEAVEKYECEDDDNLAQNVKILARRLILLEEDSLGPSLWNRQQKASKDSQSLDWKGTMQSIPQAKEGTLTQYFVEALIQSSELDHPSKFALALECLHVLSLPSQFAGLLAKAVDRDAGKKEMINMLIAQLSIERRSAADRREFIQISLSYAQKFSEIFSDHLETGALRFLSSLSVVIPQWTSATTQETIPKLWSHCNHDASTKNNPQYALCFLESMKSILKSEEKKTSPAIINAVHKILLDVVFPSLCDDFDHCPRLQSMLFCCCTEISMSVLLEFDMFTFGNRENLNIYRAQLIAYLQNKGLLQSKDPYLLRAALWVGKKQRSLADKCSDVDRLCWKASCQIATAASKMPAKARIDMINALLEIMEVHSEQTFSLPLLLISAAIWAEGTSVNFQVMTSFDSTTCSLDKRETKRMIELQHQMPQIGVVSVKLNISHVVMKKTLALTQKSIRSGENYACLTKIFSSLKNTDSLSLENALVSASLCELHKQ